MNIHPRVRHIFQEFLLTGKSTRQERWANMLAKAEPKNSADHRGLQIAFDQLEREFSGSTSPA